MDDIQRKLALIDAQLTGGPLNTYKQIISTAPLLFAATGLIAGILLQNALFEPRIIWFWLILLALSAIAAVLIFTFPKAAKLSSFALVLLSTCALICFTCLGAIRLTSFRQPKPDDIRNFVTDQRKLAIIRGLIATEPYINNYGYYAKNPNSPQDSNETDDPNNYEGVYQRWKFAKFMHNDPATSFYLKVSEVETVNGWAKASGTVRVQVAEPVLDLSADDYIQAYCWLDRFKQPTNPGQFNIAKYLARKNVFIAASVKSRNGIELRESSSADFFTKLRRRLRETATVGLLGNLSPEDRNRGLLEALLLGYRGNIDSSTYRAFRKTGLLHFISLSGMHLGILIGVIWFLCKAAGLMKPARAIVCIIAICLFLLIVPPRAPTLRAAIIGYVFCASFLFRRRSNSLNTLSLAAIILLLIRPTSLFEAGWQLSFASVLGLLLFCHRIHFFLYEKITGLPWPVKAPKAKPFFRIVSRPGPYLLRLFSTGLTAWVAGAGVLLYHFYTINPLTCLWTVIAFLPVALILTIGYLKIILSLLLPTVAALLGVIVTALAASLIWIVEHIAALGISQILIGHVPLALIILYYCFVLFAGFVYVRRPLIRKAICTMMVLAIVAFLGVTKWQRTYRDDLVLTCLDVGHGQAILAQLPGSANILFDAGSLYKSNIGRRIVTPFLDYIGTNKIDAIIISHNDVDHINGIPEIVEYCKVHNVYANDAFFSQPDPWATAEFLDKSLREKGFKVHRLGQDLNAGSSANIRMLWPSKDMSQYEQLSDNDKSLVSLIEFAGKKILLCSDIEKFAQKELLKTFPNLRADAVIVPHHGSTKTAEPAFLENLDAEILICSCGRSQYERQQVERQGNEQKWLYTAKDGAIIVHIDKKGTLQTETFVKQE